MLRKNLISEGGDAVHDSSEPNARRQYTVKGIDHSTIDLMRAAARADGMKINSWISSRMRDAAERSLTHSKDSPYLTCISATEADTGESFKTIMEAFESYRLRAEERIEKLEKEVHEIASSQRTILTKMVERSN